MIRDVSKEPTDRAKPPRVEGEPHRSECQRCLQMIEVEPQRHYMSPLHLVPHNRVDGTPCPNRTVGGPEMATRRRVIRATAEQIARAAKGEVVEIVPAMDGHRIEVSVDESKLLTAKYVPSESENIN